MDPRKNEDAEFAYGSGHINPLKAADPGLIFDASEIDFVNFLCSEGYNNSFIGLITGDSSTCPDTPGTTWDLNYPSFALSLLDGQEINVTYPRTVTNVGNPNSTYYSNVSMPASFSVIVEPAVLSFSQVGETQSFTVTLTGSPLVQTPLVSGFVEWRDGNAHVVRTPIAVFNNIPSIFASLGSTGTLNKDTELWKGSKVSTKNGILRAEN